MEKPVYLRDAVHAWSGRVSTRRRPIEQSTLVATSRCWGARQAPAAVAGLQNANAGAARRTWRQAAIEIRMV